MNSARSVRLMKPGPETSTFSMTSSAASFAAMAVATSRGFFLSLRASASARSAW